MNRFYKRHSRRSDNPEGLDTKNSLMTNDPAEKLNKLESLQLNNLNSLSSYQDAAKNKNIK